MGDVAVWVGGATTGVGRSSHSRHCKEEGDGENGQTKDIMSMCLQQEVTLFLTELQKVSGVSRSSTKEPV